MKFADIKNDIAFGKIFGNENHKQVIISFLNAILDFTGEQRIIDVSILGPYQLPALTGGKYSIVDVKAKDQRGGSYLIEMQMTDEKGFDKRVRYNVAKAYLGQIERGAFYKDLKPVVFIGIVDFNLTEDPKYLNRHRVQNIETGEHILKDIEFNFIELPKFNLGQEGLSTLAEKWIYFIKNAENLDVLPDNIDDEGLKLAWEDANMHTWSKNEEDAYISVSFREQGWDNQLERAGEIGEKKGIDNLITKFLKNSSLSIEEIAKNAEVSIDYVKNLAEKLKDR